LIAFIKARCCFSFCLSRRFSFSEVISWIISVNAFNSPSWLKMGSARTDHILPLFISIWHCSICPVVFALQTGHSLGIALAICKIWQQVLPCIASKRSPNVSSRHAFAQTKRLSSSYQANIAGILSRKAFAASSKRSKLFIIYIIPEIKG